MAHGGIKNIKKHADHGKSHNNKDKAVRKAENRARDPRIQAAMDQTQAARAELEVLMAQDRTGETAGAVYAREAAQRRLVEAKEDERRAEEAFIKELNSHRTRPCPDADKKIDHEPHVWDAGALGTKRSCMGYYPDDIVEDVEPAPSGAPVVSTSRIQEVDIERVYVHITHKIDIKDLPQEGEGKWAFSYHTACIMLKEGYNLAKVIKYTGIGAADLSHIPVDDEGYYTELEDDDETSSEDS